MRPVAILLAGGQARRMGGGDKALRILAGLPILTHVVERMRDQVDVLALNANGDAGRFRDWSLPVVPDSVPDQPGPLAGILAGMEWVSRHVPAATDIVSVSTDTPFLPRDLVDRLVAVRTAAGADVAIAMSGAQSHPVVALWPVRLAAELRHTLMQEGLRQVTAFAHRFVFAYALFPDLPIDPFYNVNNPGDLVDAEYFAASIRREEDSNLRNSFSF